jgi:hypothetical protein
MILALTREVRSSTSSHPLAAILQHSTFSLVVLDAVKRLALGNEYEPFIYFFYYLENADCRIVCPPKLPLFFSAHL